MTCCVSCTLGRLIEQWSRPGTFVVPGGSWLPFSDDVGVVREEVFRVIGCQPHSAVVGWGADLGEYSAAEVGGELVEASGDDQE